MQWIDAPVINGEASFTQDFLNFWRTMALAGMQGDPFACSPGWQVPFHCVYAPTRRLAVAAADDALLLFAENKTDDRIYLSAIDTGWMYSCPLLGNAAVQLFVDTLDEIFSAYSRPPIVLIGGMHQHHPYGRQLLTQTGSDISIAASMGAVICRASLAGGLDGYLSRRSSNLRRNLKKARIRALDAGIYFQTPELNRSTVDGVYDRMLAVERTSWKGKAGEGMDSALSCDFYRAMARLLVRSDEARVIFARHEEEDIGFIFGGVLGAAYRGQQFSYNTEWAKYSIGDLLQIEQIRALADEGIRYYDMGPISGPRMEYKSHWTEMSLQLQTWYIERKGAAPHFAAGAS